MDVVFFRFLDFTFLGGLYFSFSMQIFRLTSTSLLVSALHVYVILFEITKYLTSFRHHFFRFRLTSTSLLASALRVCIIDFLILPNI